MGKARARVRKKLSTTTHGLEQSLLQRFVREYSLLGEQPADDLDLYVAARHAGLPTRLLDWTTNPLVALYFAASSGKKKDDVAVCALDIEAYLSEAFDLNRENLEGAIQLMPKSHPFRTGVPPASYACTPQVRGSELIQTSVQALTQSWFSQLLTDPGIIFDPKMRGPAATLATFGLLIPFIPFSPPPSHARVVAQESKFTFHPPQELLRGLCRSFFGQDDLEIAKFESRILKNSQHFQEWTIPAGSKANIVHELRLLGISQSTMFRDADSIVHELQAMYGLH